MTNWENNDRKLFNHVKRNGKETKMTAWLFVFINIYNKESL